MHGMKIVMMMMIIIINDKFVSVIIGALGTNRKGLVQNFQLLPCHRGDHRATESHTNEHCTYHS